MSRHASAARFGDGGVAGEWYNPPYPRTLDDVAAYGEMFRRRADWLAARYPAITKIGIAGAGFGLTGYYLSTAHAKDVYMCDTAWATGIGTTTLGPLGTRLGAHDIATSTGATGFRRMGNTGSNKYPLIFTEDLLPCAESEAEAQAMLTNLRAAGTTLVHLITPSDGAGIVATPDMLWRTMAQWRALIGPGEVIVHPSLQEVP